MSNVREQWYDPNKIIKNILKKKKFIVTRTDDSKTMLYTLVKYVDPINFHLVKQPVIYFFVNRRTHDLDYVGKSICFPQRISQHHVFDYKIHDVVIWETKNTLENTLYQFESILIANLKPRLNRTHKEN